MKNYSERFEIDNYRDDPQVIIGLHDGRLIDSSSFEISERLINRLQHIAKGYELHLTPLIDSYEDIGFNKTQCINLIDELDFIRNIVKDDILETLILKIIDLANICVSKNNKRIQLYIAGN